MLRVVSALLVSVLVSLAGVGAFYASSAPVSASGVMGSVLNTALWLAKFPLLALAQTAPAFAAAYFIGRRGWLVGALVGGSSLPIAVIDIVTQLPQAALGGTGTLIYVPGLSEVSIGIGGAIIGAFAGAAGVARRTALPSNKSFERPPDGPVTPLAEQPARQSRGAAQLNRYAAT